MNDAHKAIRLALLAGGWDELLPSSDHGDDLFDDNLIITNPENDAWSDLTESGKDLIRRALAEGN